MFELLGKLGLKGKRDSLHCLLVWVRCEGVRHLDGLTGVRHLVKIKGIKLYLFSVGV